MIPRTLLVGCVGTGITMFMQPVSKAECVGQDKLISMEIQKLKRKKYVPTFSSLLECFTTLCACNYQHGAG
jgi:hypothetical protein